MGAMLDWVSRKSQWVRCRWTEADGQMGIQLMGR